MRSRPQTVSAAAIVLALFSVLNLVFPLFPIEGIHRRLPFTWVLCWALLLVSVVVAGLWLLRKVVEHGERLRVAVSPTREIRSSSARSR